MPFGIRLLNGGEDACQRAGLSLRKNRARAFVMSTRAKTRRGQRGMIRNADIAAACSFLCSESGSYIAGQLIGVNGGMYI
jgi:NAD(P)-dependent dehydrogenase (short-subunit alcohol dehydrogenase family)